MGYCTVRVYGIYEESATTLGEMSFRFVRDNGEEGGRGGLSCMSAFDGRR